jgi:hypothetical protein
MSQKHAAYLVMDDMGDFVTDFHLSFEPMAALGWETTTVPWRSRPDWSVFDAVYIGVPWDYPQFADEFLAVLEEIDRSGAWLLNDLSTVRWNLDKSYMRDVAARGDDIVPSHWSEGFEAADVAGFFAAHDVDKVVIKPTVGGNALDTFILTNPVPDDMLELLADRFTGRPFFVQPFIESIRDEGEYSLFFFNGEYSHAIVKTPKAGDFRVQEEHGAKITPTTPPEGMLDVAQRVFSHIEPLPVYGRGDWVRGPDGRFLLMELELIEPSLYLRTDSGAALRFARAFDQRFQKFARK